LQLKRRMFQRVKRECLSLMTAGQVHQNQTVAT
jgi:hypothetical protein